jgi:hypothetical protein
MWLQVYDAKTMSPEPVAQIELPQRVPGGLHGTWITRDQLEKQAGYKLPAPAGQSGSGAADGV